MESKFIVLVSKAPLLDQLTSQLSPLIVLTMGVCARVCFFFRRDNLLYCLHI